ncbi:MAG: YbgC/FadM family acyl-CoA thioesterase [Candidatus Omnitrophica bacterium]|nr:YbgC/FadM family acyl-CoA thioesterase [Candidatus Omnitrophota bacterium]
MHQYTKKIYYHDTDCGGVVYYANYMKFLEEARTEFLAERGINLSELAAKGVWFVVKKVNIEYKSPARYSDLLNITTELTAMKNVSLEFLQTIKCQDRLLVETKTILVSVSAENGRFSAAVIPSEVRRGLVQ